MYKKQQTQKISPEIRTYVQSIAAPCHVSRQAYVLHVLINTYDTYVLIEPHRRRKYENIAIDINNERPCLYKRRQNQDKTKHFQSIHKVANVRKRKGGRTPNKDQRRLS